MKNSKRLTNIILVLIVAAVAATVLACGSDPEPDPTSVATATESQPTATTGSGGSMENPTATTGGSGPTEDPTATTAPTMESETIQEPCPTPPPVEETFGERPMAPELVGITGWINTEPFTMEDLRGKVVLVDFWTYTCVNCIRTFPFLRDWNQKYADHGLVIVGVHAPEFEFEKVKENVEEASIKHELGWPIAQDNDFDTWRAYSNRAWPSKYLIDKDGLVRYAHVGEGAYNTTEQKIQELLFETGACTSHIPVGSVTRPNLDPQAGSGGQTRELYAGRDRNRGNLPYIANQEYFEAPPDTPILYNDPGGHMNHRLYLHGLWENGAESVTHARVTENLEDYVAINFLGTTVNTVLDFDGGEPFKVYVTLAGEPIPQDFSGADIQWDEDGKAYFMVDEPRMYRVVELPSYGGTELQLSSNSDRFSLFTFTFGSYVEGP